jgi:hypothetical protein
LKLARKGRMNEKSKKGFIELERDWQTKETQRITQRERRWYGGKKSKKDETRAGPQQTKSSKEREPRDQHRCKVKKIKNKGVKEWREGE